MGYVSGNLRVQVNDDESGILAVGLTEELSW